MTSRKQRKTGTDIPDELTLLEDEKDLARVWRLLDSPLGKRLLAGAIIRLIKNPGHDPLVVIESAKGRSLMYGQREGRDCPLYGSILRLERALVEVPEKATEDDIRVQALQPALIALHRARKLEASVKNEAAPAKRVRM